MTLDALLPSLLLVMAGHFWVFFHYITKAIHCTIFADAGSVLGVVGSYDPICNLSDALLNIMSQGPNTDNNNIMM